MPNQSSDNITVDTSFARRTAIVFGTAIGLLLLWQLSVPLLLAFGAVIVAVLLRGIADPITSRTPLGQGAAVAVAGLIVVASISVVIWLFGSALAEQMRQLLASLPTSAADFRSMVESWPFGEQLAAPDGWELMAWTLLVYVIVQQVEGNLIYPFIRKRAVALPPVLTLFGILAFGTLFGLPGVLVATPLIVVVVVVVNVRLLYRRKTLGEDIPVPGEART